MEANRKLVRNMQQGKACRNIHVCVWWRWWWLTKQLALPHLGKPRGAADWREPVTTEKVLGPASFSR